MNTGSKQGPSLRRHKTTGHAFARFNGKQIWFGPYDGPEAHARFAAFKAEWEANGRSLPLDERSQAMVTVADLVARYLEHAEVYYRKPDGTPTHEIVNTRYTVKPLLELYGLRCAAEFDLRCLKTVRERMVNSGLARTTVNNRVWRVVHIFGWAAEEELVAPEVYGGLRALRPLRRGRSRAPETEPVRAVTWEEVAAVADLVCKPVRAMIMLQWYTGMRPGEVVQLKPADLDLSDLVWLYKPQRHKLEHHGKERVVAIGPKAQEVLSPFLLRVPQPTPDAPVFSPRDAMTERHARARAARKTPLWPSHERAQARKRLSSPGRQPSVAYTVDSYRRAIKRACAAAGVEPWSPNRLRHAAATRIRKEHGLEAARVVLGHTSAATTEVYAELDQARALDVMRQSG